MTKTKQALAEPETGADASGHEGASHPLPVARNAPSQAVALATAYSPPELLNLAIIKKSDIAVIERLSALAERWQTTQQERYARQAFDNAMADAKAHMPSIKKNRRVNFTSDKGTTDYRYEDLAAVIETVQPVLAQYGLNFRFRTTQPEPGQVVVTCILSHRDGHYEENTLGCAVDTSGRKNHLQAIMSAVAYLERYTLKAAVGVAAGGEDDDGRKAGDLDPNAETVAVVTPEQVAVLKAKCAEVKCPEKKFLDWAKVESFEAIPADYFEGCMQGLSSFTKAG